MNMQTRLQELQKQMLQLPVNERWQLVEAFLESLQQETSSTTRRGNLSRLRGIAKSAVVADNTDPEEDYANYLTKKYQ